MRVFAQTLNLNNYDSNVDLSDVLAPFNLTIDPKNLSFPKNILSILYDWGDGEKTLIKYKPQVGLNYNLPIPSQLGSPLNYPQSHNYYSNDGTLVYNIKVYVTLFGQSDPEIFNINLSLKNPDLDYGENSIFDEFHLVKTRMFSSNNTVLYVFQSTVDKNNSLMLMMVDWNKAKEQDKAKITPPLQRPYEFNLPFLNSSIKNNNIKVISADLTDFNGNYDIPPNIKKL